MFHMNQIGVSPAPLPTDRVVNSAMMDFTMASATNLFSAPVSIALHYFEDSGELDVYRYADSLAGWQPVPTSTMDVADRIATVETLSLNVYVVLMKVHPGLELAPAGQSAGGCPGIMATYVFTVTNTGDYTDTVNLAASGAWTSTLSALAIPSLGANEEATATLTVEIPVTASVGMSDALHLSATSAISPALQRTAQATIEVKGVPGLEISPNVATGSGYPGDAVTYAFTVTNTGGCTDALTLAAGGSWTPTLSTYSLGPLGPGLAEAVTLTVEIPLAAAEGMSEPAAITVTSALSPAFGRTARATTTAKARRVYLPVVLKGWGP